MSVQPLCLSRFTSEKEQAMNENYHSFFLLKALFSDIIKDQIWVLLDMNFSVFFFNLMTWQSIFKSKYLWSKLCFHSEETRVERKLFSYLHLPKVCKSCFFFFLRNLIFEGRSFYRVRSWNKEVIVGSETHNLLFEFPVWSLWKCPVLLSFSLFVRILHLRKGSKISHQ